MAHYLEKKLGSHHLSIYKVELHEERRPKCERLNYKISGKKVGDLDSGMKNDFLSKFQKRQKTDRYHSLKLRFYVQLKTPERDEILGDTCNLIN